MSVAGWLALPGARIAVQGGDFDIAAELARTRHLVGGRVGAIATFVGLVRDHFDAAPAAAQPGLPRSEPVTELFLEHYPGMTERSIAAMVTQAQARWQLLDVCVIHRIGALAPGDQIVYVQTAAGHRPDAFAACEFLMDYLKTEAVLWKREQQGDAQRWLSASADDDRRRASWAQAGAKQEQGDD